jgi:hypothetical protein
MELRVRPLFTGHPHRDYLRHHKELEPIFTDIFPSWNRHSGSQEIAPLADIPPATLHHWKTKWRAQADWRPWHSQVHGAHHRVFSDEQELELLDDIIVNYIVPGKMFNIHNFRLMALSKYAAGGGDPGKFQCSQQFVQDFKTRHKLSSRRFHMRRRNRGADLAQVIEWTDEMQRLLSSVEANRIVNCDETCWRVIPTGLLTWAPVAADSVSVIASADEKSCITALASVTAGYEKLPLYLIAKGLTERAERGQLGPHAGHEADHSESGWSTRKTFHKYLHWLRSIYPDGKPLHLILDSYSVHRAAATKTVARRLGIQLHFIPAGWTDTLQPLDRYIFGALKSMCRRLFHRHLQHDDDGRITKPDAIQFLIEAWNTLSTSIVRKAWGIYEDVMGDPEADDDDDEWNPLE